MSTVLQLLACSGASWLLWQLTQFCYRPRVPRDARQLDRWPVEVAEPAAGAPRTPVARSSR
jgi:hypothetical protein